MYYCVGEYLLPSSRVGDNVEVEADITCMPSMLLCSKGNHALKLYPNLKYLCLVQDSDSLRQLKDKLL